ncbi:hydroxyacylglutathione hydrolase [Blochmannia endosymbiont of Colobopsis nipponica]|uniref:hydroxyacylglutathione hydrolase n=1 Tax=Blochmannia endosymbiont of Colobopsis nipponica TaxID=2681987 RepID=UPI00178282B0|nr:hydroxyacylglutathione hydrolase [Blochmannia endosymbiont of Colobopsis nipponica]QOI11197.1 hydroxyacylglutathione hydrolase [Blochmannia endosymbiont of Colobopsis nipponica]
MNIINIPALKDNYIWILYNAKKECLIIDPGEYISIIQIIQKLKLKITAILLTHHHKDHTAGVRKLLKLFPVKVYGPLETVNAGTNHIVSENDILTLLGYHFKVLFLPGHTLGHVAFYSKPWLFCGDALFSAGCGRLFEGTAKQMYESLQKIKQLPGDTLIYSAHEYTWSNINFAASILPKDNNIISYLKNVKKKRIKNESTLPTSINKELKINLFFRCKDKEIQKKLNTSSNNEEEWKIFAKLRTKRDLFT